MGHEGPPLNILQVGAFPFPSHQGSQVYAGGMCRALAERGHGVTLACFAHGEGTGPVGVEVVRARGVPGSTTLRSGPHWSRPMLDGLLVRAVRRVLRRTGERAIDVVHAHNVEAPGVAWLAARLARLGGGRSARRPRLEYTLHTSMEQELPVYFEHRWVRRAARPVGRWVDGAVPRLCDGGVALSAEAEALLRAAGMRQVVRVPAGVDPAELTGGDADRARARWELGAGSWVVYTGNTDAYQDLPVLFEAMTRVPEAGLLVVTGSDPEPWRVRARRLGLGRWRVVPSRDFADTLDALAAAQVAALPRTQCAGFPIKLLNQLGAGVPTVAAEGSARRIAGVVPVANGDAVAMARALRTLLADAGQRRALGEAGRAAVARDYAWSTQAARLERWYRALLGTRC